MASTKKSAKGRYDIVGMGAALLDLTVKVEESFLKAHGFQKSRMYLIDGDAFAKLLKDLPQRRELSAGGSAGNTLAIAAMLGAKAVFIGKRGDDAVGEDYGRLTEECGVTPQLAQGDQPQGTCIVLVTPDGERTFATYLGASTTLSAKEVDFSVLEKASILHLEGYMLDSPLMAEAAFTAAKMAKKLGVQVSVDLGDSALITRRWAALQELLKIADIVFANEDEARVLTKIDDPSRALVAIKSGRALAVITLGEHGSMVADDTGVHEVSAHKVRVANTNGAGDAYAGAFLYGITSGLSSLQAGRLASAVAAMTVAVHSARPTREALIPLKSSLATIGKR